jgi:UDP-N-acetylmuramoyl-tripeptide--D-alanyl-D-alanine ligase
MNFWTPDEFANVTQGRWLVAPARGAVPLTGLTIDSRAVPAGSCFLAIKGDRFDGHDFVAAAFEHGAALAVVQRDAAPGPTPASGSIPQSGAESRARPVLVVDDTLAALHALARAWRGELRKQGVRVIAVGGSNGKTTTRHILHHILSAQLAGTQSPKSFNNHIGVPLTLLSAAANHQFVVVEIGSNHPGEVAQLAALVAPDAAIVTSIGREHLEFFKTVEGVAQEEFALLQYVAEDGLAVIPPASLCPAGVPTPKVKCNVRAFDDRDPALPAVLPIPGIHNRRNAAAAALIARWMGLSDDAIGVALADVQPVEGRLQTLHFGSPPRRVTVIHDAYNANPDSMRAALDVLVQMPVGDSARRGKSGEYGESEPSGAQAHGLGRRVAVLGDMFELGQAGPEEHRALGREAAQLGDAIGLLVFVGRLSMFAAEVAARLRPPEAVHVIPTADESLGPAVADLLGPGDVVLLKASRGMRLERIIPAVREKFTPRAAADPPR